MVYTHLGAGAYICGEESALLESLEGKLGQPRVRPPFPAQKGGGLYGEPTVVNNVETLTNVPWIVVNGATAYKAINGNEQSPGTKIFCLSGHVNKPGNYELPMGVTFRELIYEHGGGITNGKKIKAILPSGGSGPILNATDEVLDTKLTYEDVVKVGSMLGSASVIVMDEDTDITWVAAKITKFFKHESCGKCTPCREGTGWLWRMMERMVEGRAVVSDIDLMLDVASRIEGHTICALGDAAAWPVQGLVRHFRPEIERRIAEFSRRAA